MVERHLAKVDVAGPTPVFRSKFKSDSGHLNRFFVILSRFKNIVLKQFISIFKEQKVKLTTEFTSLEKSAVKLTVTIAKKDVQESYNGVLTKYTKNAQIPGFRKGHVPANILERKYGEGIKADALSEIIDSSLNEIFEKETENRPLPYQQPAMEKVPELDLTKDLTYSVTYDVFPKVEVSNLSGITVKEPQVTISDKDLENELKAIQERNAVVIDKKADEPAEKDNIVTVDYEEENGEKRNGYVFTIGSGEDAGTERLRITTIVYQITSKMRTPLLEEKYHVKGTEEGKFALELDGYIKKLIWRKWDTTYLEERMKQEDEVTAKVEADQALVKKKSAEWKAIMEGMSFNAFLLFHSKMNELMKTKKASLIKYGFLATEMLDNHKRYWASSYYWHNKKYDEQEYMRYRKQTEIIVTIFYEGILRGTQYGNHPRTKYALKIHSIIEELMNKDWSKVNNNIK